MTDNIHTVNLPDIGEGVVEGEIVQWLKNIGDELQQDEAVVIVMTDKATVELPAPYPGILSKQYFSAGEIAIKDKPLYDITLQEAINLPKKKEVKSSQQSVQASPKRQTLISTPSMNKQKSLATPSVRKLAKDLQIDINTVQGSGLEGRVNKEDLQEYCSRKESNKPVELTHFPDDIIQPLAGIPKLMAEKMVESKQNIPHFSYFEQVDATRLIQLRENIKKRAEEENIHLTYMPLLIRALSLCCQKFPEINSCIDMVNNEVILHKQHHIGIAVNTKLGLIVPVIHSVQEMTLEEIIKEYERVKYDALNHRLKSKEMKGSTISISNFGVLGGGGMWATPIINSPEVAILAVARIQKRPIVKNGELVVRDTLNLSWSFDHRIIDGNKATKISHFFASLLENPAALI